MQWYALYANSRAEKKIGETLAAAGIVTYVPLVKTMRQWSDRKKMIELPLLNGYVFVKALQTQFDRILQTRGVVNFVRSEGKIATIREVEINRLKQLVELGYQIDSSAIKRRYNEGDKIKINSGPLKDIEGFVVNQKENRYIEVLLESIGQCIKVKLPQELILPM